MTHKFQDKLDQAPSNIILYINPIFELLPIPILRYDDPFLPFTKAIIPATHDLVAGYMFDFASFLSMAGAGAVALERSIALVPQDRVRILHMPVVGTGYSAMAEPTAFDLDALTVTNSDDYHYYHQNSPYTAFITSPHDDLNVYDASAHQLTYEGRTLQLTNNDILYTSKQDDYLDKLRESIQSIL